MNVQTEIVAVTNPNSLEATGLIVYWSLTGGDADHTSLVECLDANGIDPEDAPPLTTIRVAFARACLSFRTSTHKVQRSKTERETFFMIDEVEIDGQYSAQSHVKARLNIANVVEAEGDNQEETRTKVQAEFEHQLQRCASTDIAAWLTKTAFALQGLALRQTGGFYFIPAHSVEAWNNLVSALHDAAPHYKVYGIPAMRTEETVDALIDAITREAEVLVAEIEEAITAEGVGSRALRARSLRACEMSNKVKKYEGLLEQKIGNLSQKLTELDAAAVVAALKAGMAKDSK